jgi:RHS repeat-associated protein
MQTAYIYDEPPRCASHFTGKERDTETGLDYFGARYYGSTMGRWMSPDWSASPTPVPYAELRNPQSLNLYTYLNNSPVTRTDPDGHGDDYCWAAAGWTYIPDVLGAKIDSPKKRKKLSRLGQPSTRPCSRPNANYARSRKKTRREGHRSVRKRYKRVDSRFVTVAS